MADEGVICGLQAGLGKFMTEKINLTQPATVTLVTYEGAGPGFSIWSQQPYPKVEVCWDVGDTSRVGTVRPVERG